MHMSSLLTPLPAAPPPDHTQLPDSDGAFVENIQEHPQSVLLTDSVLPMLQRRHPDGRFAIGQDAGIYWRITDPPLRGAVAPDWYYVPDVPPTLHGRVRRSYVLWQEFVAPLILMEFVSGDGSEERDRTPWEGKFWIYERVVRPGYYAIYEVDPGRIEMYQMIGGTFSAVAANSQGRYPIPELGLALGLWQGSFLGMELPWMRWWDEQGRLLPTGHERAERLAERLRALGVNPDEV
jgi:Uma2 family endonuclease